MEIFNSKPESPNWFVGAPKRSVREPLSKSHLLGDWLQLTPSQGQECLMGEGWMPGKLGRWGRNRAEVAESAAREENSISSRRSRWKPGKWQTLRPSSRAIGKDEQGWQLQSRKKLSCSKSRLLQMSLGWSFNQGGIAWLSWVWELKGVTFLPGNGEPSLLPLSILLLFSPFYLSYLYPLLFGENFIYVPLLRVDRY